MELHDLKTSGNKKLGAINDTTTFQIRDEDAFGRFSAYLITAKNFTWRLESKNLRVRAASFPVAKGIKFKKDLTLNGNVFFFFWIFLFFGFLFFFIFQVLTVSMAMCF